MNDDDILVDLHRPGSKCRQKVLGRRHLRYGRDRGRALSDRRSKQKPFLTVVADEAAQARFVALQILDSREAGVPLKSQAVLFRASHHSAQLEIELTRRNIPFVKYGGLQFLEAAHIK